MFKLVEEKLIEGVTCKNVLIKDIPQIHAENFQGMKDHLMGTGVGISAPQIGVNKRFFMMKIDEEVIMVFNPKITFQSPQKSTEYEGCMSYNRQATQVQRAKVVAFEFRDEKGKKRSLVLKSWNARILQHEYDHLDGITIYHQRAN